MQQAGRLASGQFCLEHGELWTPREGGEGKARAGHRREARRAQRGTHSRRKECITVCRGTWVRCQSSSLENMNSNPKVRVQALPSCSCPRARYPTTSGQFHPTHSPGPASQTPQHTTSPSSLAKGPRQGLLPRVRVQGPETPATPERAHLLLRTRETEGIQRG